jgi:hypothetical protein
MLKLVNWINLFEDYRMITEWLRYEINISVKNFIVNLISI